MPYPLALRLNGPAPAAFKLSLEAVSMIGANDGLE